MESNSVVLSSIQGGIIRQQSQKWMGNNQGQVNSSRPIGQNGNKINKVETNSENNFNNNLYKCENEIILR